MQLCMFTFIFYSSQLLLNLVECIRQQKDQEAVSCTQYNHPAIQLVYSVHAPF